MRAYYNEHDPYAAEWLRNLIAEGLIPDGDVDERDIQQVQAGDIISGGYTMVHLFAGIGGWPLALRMAGWRDDWPVWTGSCPCQPFSCAGSQAGTNDERHLWPEFARLIRVCRPPVVFGEQVEGAVRLGWLDGVFADLEAADYSCGAAVLGAHSVGAPHIRQRLYWVADANDGRQQKRHTGRDDMRHVAAERGDVGRLADAGSQRRNGEHALLWPEKCGRNQTELSQIAGSGTTHRMANMQGEGLSRREHGGAPGEEEGERARLLGTGGHGEACWLADDAGRGQRIDGGAPRDAGYTDECGEACWVPCPCDCGEFWCNIHGMHTHECPCPPIDEWGDIDPYSRRMGDGIEPGLQGYAGHEHDGHEPGRPGTASGGPVATAGAWDYFRIVPCRDGKIRRVGAEPGDEPLAHGLPRSVGREGPWPCGLDDLAAARASLKRAKANRVGRLKGYGNAIVPELAAEFVRTYMEIRGLS